ncbi:hypothetical protein B296_00046159 [Ensete ventricosum]|uniref:Uncharacterized protein n=1 Tax=Ensete ventricosum TaxID=4639 RepID=A0A426XLU9_ENSVE|nr:hypothetical protein B296_00046159 [Ensete ventricosum]
MTARDTKTSRVGFTVKSRTTLLKTVSDFVVTSAGRRRRHGERELCFPFLPTHPQVFTKNHFAFSPVSSALRDLANNASVGDLHTKYMRRVSIFPSYGAVPVRCLSYIDDRVDFSGTKMLRTDVSVCNRHARKKPPPHTQKSIYPCSPTLLGV